VKDDELETTIELEGVRYVNWAAKQEKARALGHRLACRGLVAYAVIDPGEKGGHSDSLEKRADGRNRTRLRSAKLLDLGDRFLCECLIHDRSTNGLRLVLQRNLLIPRRLQLCDDESLELALVTVAWRRGAQIGVRLTGKDEFAWRRQGVRAALRGRYYAIPD